MTTKERASELIAFRAPVSGAKRLEDLARQAECTKAEILRRLIDCAEVTYEAHISLRPR